MASPSQAAHPFEVFYLHTHYNFCVLYCVFVLIPVEMKGQTIRSLLPFSVYQRLDCCKYKLFESEQKTENKNQPKVMSDSESGAGQDSAGGVGEITK